jgi:hypothetical protein
LATESVAWGKASNPKLFQTSKDHSCFCFWAHFRAEPLGFGNLETFLHFILETWKRSRSGNLKKVKKWKLVQKRVRALRENSLASHKTWLILKEKSPCVGRFNENETIINGIASKAFERCLRRTLSAESIPCRCELHLPQSKRKKVCFADAHYRTMRGRTNKRKQLNKVSRAHLTVRTPRLLQQLLGSLVFALPLLLLIESKKKRSQIENRKTK